MVNLSVIQEKLTSFMLTYKMKMVIIAGVNALKFALPDCRKRRLVSAASIYRG